jgi:hypothetical protein
MVQACQAQLDLVERLAGRTNEHAASDLDVAAMLLESAARAAAANVTANLPAIEDEGFSAAVRAELAQRLQVIQSTADRAHERVARAVPRRPEGEGARERARSDSARHGEGQHDDESRRRAADGVDPRHDVDRAKRLVSVRSLVPGGVGVILAGRCVRGLDL